jgi:hypothetical protein
MYRLDSCDVRRIAVARGNNNFFIASIAIENHS